MASHIQYALIRPREEHTLDRFTANDANWYPEDGGHGPLRFHGGRGAFFDYKTRTTSDQTTWRSWVHTGDEGNNFFSPVAATQLAAGIGAADTTLPVDDASGITAGGYVKIQNEIVKVGTIVYDVAGNDELRSCLRGQLGTAAAVHATVDVFSQISPYGSRIHYAQGQAAFFWDTDQGHAGSFAAIALDGDVLALSSFARLDERLPDANVWPGYSEGIRGKNTLGKGSVFWEKGIMNFAGDHPSGPKYRGGRPYQQGWAGQTLGEIIQAGGHNTNAYNVDNPGFVVASAGGAKFHRGYGFEVGSGENPEGERFEAYMLPEDYTITWYAPDDERALDIFSTISDSTYAVEFLAGDDGFTMRKRSDGKGIAKFKWVASAVNYPAFTPAATGTGPLFAPEGDDANIDNRIGARGTGTVKFISNVSTLFMAAPLYAASYTVAGLPSAATARGIIYVSDESGGATIAFSDGTNWRRVQDRAIVS